MMAKQASQKGNYDLDPKRSTEIQKNLPKTKEDISFKIEEDGAQKAFGVA